MKQLYSPIHKQLYSPIDLREIERILAHTLQSCASGRELIERGFAQDVDLAVATNVSACVPSLTDEAFVSSNLTIEY